ncbi:hypothetical protein [Butyrivibrio sp. AE2032]|uniref:hypothetical protein n=1 Tax=Butyrivibrio sp. AE2032 TaxID=1458463 RepID=UPI000A7B5DF7|nr:hypothetical protein [Butyrivibrio sp. AE2032]
MNTKIVSVLLACCVLLSFTGCNKPSSNDRETTFAGETMNTVNPDVSQPQQSIPSDAMITETETENTAPAKNGNTYTINGVEFTISVRIEDYLYDLPGSDAKYIDLDKFMEAYGFKSEGKWPEERCSYENSDGICFQLDRKDTPIYSNGLEVCSYVTATYPSGFSTEGAINQIILSTSYPLDKDNHVYVVNGYVENSKLFAKYCVSQEMLVVFAVAFEALNETGSTASAVDTLASACYCKDRGASTTQTVAIQ